MRLSEHQQIFTQHIGRLILYATGMGVGLTQGEASRPQAMQYLYFYGYTIRIKDGIPVLIKARRRSKTLKSKHLDKLAKDFNFFIDGKYTRKSHPMITALGEYWEGLDPIHNRWGGHFTTIQDEPHFERNIT